MDFYSPVQKKFQKQDYRSANSQRAWQPGEFNYLSTGKVGYLDTDMLGSDQWGTGASAQGAYRPAMIQALKASFSNANPEDYAAMDELRELYRQQVSDIPTLENMGRSNLDTSMQRGLANLLRQHNSAQAGRGTIGSRQSNSAAGDITSQIAGQYNRGILDLRNQGINQGLQLGSGLASLQARDMAERQFQLGQGQSLSSLLERMAGADQGRQAGLEARYAAEDAANKQMWGQIISAGLAAGGTALAGPPGGMAGAAAGSAAMGPTPAPTSPYAGQSIMYQQQPMSPIAPAPYSQPSYAQQLYGGYR